MLVNNTMVQKNVEVFLSNELILEKIHLKFHYSDIYRINMLNLDENYTNEYLLEEVDNM